MKSDININNKDCLLNWKEFEISRLFTIKSPAARTIKSYSEGKTPYVSSGSFNNGIVSYLEPIARLGIYGRIYEKNGEDSSRKDESFDIIIYGCMDFLFLDENGSQIRVALCS